jgi:homogentisate phytyltransferase/homogentisate geranylgeranyltransferase
MNHLKVFVAFTRPHTIIGSAVSVVALYIISSSAPNYLDPVLWLAFISALGCNVFITGYNQIVDVELDKINKPDLPIAAGDLSLKSAKTIVGISLMLSLAAAAMVSVFFIVLISIIAALGFAYSWKSVFLKSHHTTAAAAITLVRGILVNVGFYLVFSGLGFHPEYIPAEIWLLVVFISLFSLGIAWYKDIPDVGGDSAAKIGSLAIRAGVLKTFKIGTYTVASAYVIGAFAPLLITMHFANTAILCLGHAFLGLAFLSIAFRCNPEIKEEIQDFYKVFWVLFFLEYGLFVVAFYL